MTQNLHAVEPDAKLYSELVAERDAAYKAKEQQLVEKIAAAVDENKKQRFLIQQELLIKLEKLSDKLERPSIDFRFSELDLHSALSWQDAEQYLERYISVIQESKISTQNLEKTTKHMQTLSNRLLALDEKDPDQEILQLQYAFQVRKFAQQNKIAKQLKEGMEIAKNQYPFLLKHIQVDQEKFHKQGKLLDLSKKKLQQLEDETILATGSSDVLIQQQESLLAGYLGRELTDDERKCTMSSSCYSTKRSSNLLRTINFKKVKSAFLKKNKK